MKRRKKVAHSRFTYNQLDRFSRKWTIIASAIMFCVGNLFEVIGYAYGLLLAGRLVAGLGCGLFTK